MTPEEIDAAARKIVNEWWKTQDRLIPTMRLQEPLVHAIKALTTQAIITTYEDAIQIAEKYKNTFGGENHEYWSGQNSAAESMEEEFKEKVREIVSK